MVCSFSSLECYKNIAFLLCVFNYCCVVHIKSKTAKNSRYSEKKIERSNSTVARELRFDEE